MAIIPTVRCRNMRGAVAFYTGVLDFERWMATIPWTTHPSVPSLGAGTISFFPATAGRGVRQAIAVLTDNVDALFRKFRDGGWRRRATRTRPRWSTKDRSTRVGVLASST